MTDAEVRDLTVKILGKIHAELAGLRKDSAELRKQVMETNRRLGRVEDQIVHMRRDAMKRDTLFITQDKRITSVEGRLHKLEERLG